MCWPLGGKFVVVLFEGSFGSWLDVVWEVVVADDGIGLNWEFGAVDVAVEAALSGGGVGADTYFSSIEGMVALEARGCDTVAFLV